MTTSAISEFVVFSVGLDGVVLSETYCLGEEEIGGILPELIPVTINFLLR